MLGQDLREDLARLAESVLALKPLMAGLVGPVRVVPLARESALSSGDWSAGRRNRLNWLLDSVADGVGARELSVAYDADFDDLPVFERVISRWLALADWMGRVEQISAGDAEEVRRVVGGVRAESFESCAQQTTVASFDGIPLNMYAAGEGDEAVVLVSACGMPAALAESWIRFLATDRRVLTWESRGLFGAGDDDGDYAMDVGAQVADLYAVLDHDRVRTAHLIGLCGGAVIALAAAAEHPDRVTSLSLWHGAYGFADDAPTTPHQEGLIELMTAAAGSRAVARSLHTGFCQIGLTDTPDEVAHLVLYPYATPELFYRYCRLNTGITSTDVAQYLGRVRQPALVVTSQDDTIAHPDGSRRIAERLRNGVLRVEAHGDHISLFSAEPLVRMAEDFIARHPAGPASAGVGTAPAEQQPGRTT
ncbi:MAG TPA: alpha/beta hydrolase [Pseudonocardiaceae bacterium]|jgi:pimeloyl-ACP methyl ester carboxylesterase|nr:alpha/beta hydrolase [Pseudonocardiaceae bacterium]